MNNAIKYFTKLAPFHLCSEARLIKPLQNKSMLITLIKNESFRIYGQSKRRENNIILVSIDPAKYLTQSREITGLRR
jgi:hypothetical protein